MTPLELETQYHNLGVLLENLKSTKVDVRRYQNNKEKLRENVHLGNKAALHQKDLLIVRMASEVKKIQNRQKAIDKGKADIPAETVSEQDIGLWSKGQMSKLTVPEILRRYRDQMMAVHSGKGSPDQIMVCLHLVAIYGLYDKKTFGDNSAEGVKDYCDKYIGLDCNGFVGNYAQLAGYPYVPNTQISSYAPDKKKRTKIEDVKALDVLVWTDNGHIAIIDHISAAVTDAKGKSTRDCVVVESTAGNPSKGTKTEHGGLQHSTYSIVSVNKNVFTVERPKGSNKKTNVWIASL